MSLITGKVVLLFAIAMSSVRVSNGAQDSSAGPRESYFPKITLTTQDSKEVRFYEDLIKGKIVVINFMYTSCDSDL
jgi:cytochrome oxidase Cu insertion factor (SCO1/SenC/PrrC family)